MKKIRKTAFDMSTVNAAAYEKAKDEYVASYKEYHPGGFLSSGAYVSNPAAAEAKWHDSYPKGLSDWRKSKVVNVEAFMELTEKINEIIDALNSREKK